jgi:hypothetical protein
VIIWFSANNKEVKLSPSAVKCIFSKFSHLCSSK